MGGGGAMRAAAKVAGIGVVNSGIRGGISCVPPSAEHSVRNASRPVSAIISSTTGGGEVAATVQRPSWELDEWEFAGGVEEEMVVHSAEPVARVVFGGAPPSMQEAEAATFELKDALQKVYLSSPSSGTGNSDGGSQLSGLPSLRNSESLETKGCISRDPTGAPVPKYAMQAFSLLSESPKIQTVVAALASDPNVWNAVWENEALQDLLQSQNSTKEFVRDTDFQDAVSSKKFIELSDDDSEAESSQTELMDVINTVKLTVIDMVTNVSAYFQKIFSFSSAEHTPPANESAGAATIEKTIGGSLMALAVMVIMVVVLRRP
ncbi:HEAT repeat-containing [Salix suchowensis]|nr:HEAT repeat-containing [Salix suchowensis]